MLTWTLPPVKRTYVLVILWQLSLTLVNFRVDLGGQEVKNERKKGMQCLFVGISRQNTRVVGRAKTGKRSFLSVCPLVIFLYP